MWDDVQLPREADDPGERETLIQQFAEEKMREYDRTVFLCISRSDQQRRLTFRQAAQALGCTARDGRAVCTAAPAEALAKRPGRNVLFVERSMQTPWADPYTGELEMVGRWPPWRG